MPVIHPLGMTLFFFFQAEDGIRDGHVTGVQTCALPILSVRCLMWPMPRADSSATRYFVSASQRSAVYGCPISLLNEPGGATVSPSWRKIVAIRSFVEVLPAEPVTPTMLRPSSLVSLPVTKCARSESARTTAAAEPSKSLA